jgi:hypothetical protein
MGYWGTLIAVRSGENSPAILGDHGAQVRWHDGTRRGDGWRVYDVPTNVVGEKPSLLADLTAATGAPVIAAYIADSDYGQVVGADPSGQQWGAWLSRGTAYAFERDHQLMLGEARSVARSRARAVMTGFGSPPAVAARLAVRWAAEAGYSVSAGPIRQLLRTGRPPGPSAWLWLPWKRYVFAEEIYYRLLDCLGLPRLEDPSRQ